MADARRDGTAESATPRVARTGVLAGLAAAVIEMVPILMIQGLALHVGPTRILQAIASGVLGASAYSGGTFTAVLGALLHTGISIAAGLAFSFTASRLPVLLRRPVLSGLAYGIIVYLVMSYVVVPLSAVTFKPATNPMLIGMSLAIHMVAFALPISLVCRKLMRRSESVKLPTGAMTSSFGR